MQHVVAINPRELVLVVTRRRIADAGVAVEASVAATVAVEAAAAEAEHRPSLTAPRRHHLRQLRAEVMPREQTPFLIKEARRTSPGRKITLSRPPRRSGSITRYIQSRKLEEHDAYAMRGAFLQRGRITLEEGAEWSDSFAFHVRCFTCCNGARYTMAKRAMISSRWLVWL